MIHCRWAGADNPRLLPSHSRDCERPGCGGCEPCPERHCRRCGRAHVTVDGRGTDETCGPCLADTRDSLAHCWVTPELLAEALTAGPTSEAAMLIGPAADPETWQRRHRLHVNAAVGTDERHPAHRALLAWMEDCRDERHPLWVLGTWEQMVRDHLDQPAPEGRVTGAAARAYLNGHLSRLAHDPEFPFEDLARDLSACREHLETAARNSSRPETGAPCLSCGRASLVKDYGEKADDLIRWVCPRCQQWWDDGTYRSRIAATYITLADRLTASQMAAAHRVREGTVRQWANRGHVRKCGNDPEGRQLYDVRDTLAMRDRTPESA